MRRIPSLLIAATLGVALVLGSSAFHAQEYSNYVTVRGLDGKGFLQPASAGQTQDLVMNLPLMDGDTAWTESGGRVDFLMQDGNRFFLDGSTRIELDQVPSDKAQDGRALDDDQRSEGALAVQ